MNRFKEKAAVGMIWNGSFGLLTQILTIVIGVALARILDPEVFGIIAMVIIISGYIDKFLDFGLIAALIQHKDTTQIQYNTVFWIGMFSGIFFGGFFILIAPLIAQFYEIEVLKSIAYLFAGTFVFKSLTFVHQAQLNKQLAFKKLAIIQFLSNAISGFIAIYFALLGYGVWALAYKFISAPFISFILYWLFHRWYPSMCFDWSSIKNLKKFGFNLTGSKSIHYWTRKIDDLLIGKFIGSVELGLYNRAYFFLMLPLTQIKGQITKVLYPILSTLKGEEAKSLTLKSSAAIALLSFPLIMGLFVVSETFILVVLGEKWLSILPLIKVFCITSLFQVIYFPGIIFQSQARTDLQFKVNIWAQLFQITCIIIGLNWGLMGVAFSILFASVVLFYPLVYYSGQLINLNPEEVVKAVIPSFLCSASMAFLIFLLNYFLHPLLNLQLLLIVDLFSAGLIYLFIIIIVKPFPFLDMKSILYNLIQQRN